MLFMIASGLITAIAAIPVPDLAVPYAAPIAGKELFLNSWTRCASYETSWNLLVKGYQNVLICLPLKTMADVAPITPKKGEYIGLFSAVPDILDLCVLSERWVALWEVWVGAEMEGLSHVGSCQKSPLDLSHKTSRHKCMRSWGPQQGHHER